MNNEKQSTTLKLLKSQLNSNALNDDNNENEHNNEKMNFNHMGQSQFSSNQLSHDHDQNISSSNTQFVQRMLFIISY